MLLKKNLEIGRHHKFYFNSYNLLTLFGFSIAIFMIYSVLGSIVAKITLPNIEFSEIFILSCFLQ